MPDHDEPNAIAQRLMAASRVTDLRDTADETRALIAELLAVPDMPDHDLTEREVGLALLLWHKTEAAKRLLTLLERGILSY